MVCTFTSFFVRENSLSYGKITDGAAVNKISIPLNLFSYFAVLNKNNIHPNKYWDEYP